MLLELFSFALKSPTLPPSISHEVMGPEGFPGGTSGKEPAANAET